MRANEMVQKVKTPTSKQFRRKIEKARRVAPSGFWVRNSAFRLILIAATDLTPDDNNRG
jgi:hypothetical protein